MTGKRGPKTGAKYHTEFEMEAGIMLLAMNEYNYEKTSNMLNITEETLRNWEKQSLSKKIAIPALLENAIRKLLEMMPDKWTGNTWAIAFGILMDKWLLVNGQATQRTETMVSNLDQYNDNEKDAILAEAERIIQEAVSGGPDSKTTIK